jgi:hypothetical protein
MAYTLHNATIAATYDRLFTRNSTVPSTGTTTTGLVAMNDSGVDIVLPLYISTQRVGIGIAAPARNLHVDGGVGTDGNFRVSSDAGSYYGDFASGSNGLVIATSGSGSKHIILNPQNNVGIGTTTPAHKLELQDALNTAPTISILLNDAVVVDDVHIGSVLFKATASDATNEDRTGAIIRAYSDGAWSTDNGNYAPSNLSFFTQDASTGDTLAAGSERMVINANGNVGIGTVGPTTTLDLAGSFSQHTNLNGSFPCNVDERYFWMGWNLQAGGASTHFVNGENTSGTVRGFQFNQQTGNTTVEMMIAMSPQSKHGALYPGVDDAFDLGITSSWRFDDIFATNTTVSTSDISEKKDIETSLLGLDFINELNPVSYKWKSSNSMRTHYGLIAQEVKSVMDKLNIDAIDFAPWIDGNGKRYIENGNTVIRELPLDKDGNKVEPKQGLRYSEFISPMMKAIQELSAKVTALEGEDSSSDTKIAALEAKDTASEAKIVALEAKDAEYATTITALTARITALESA